MEAIFQNAVCMTCPVRKVKLWADPAYAMEKNEEAQVRETKQVLEAEQIVKGEKKAKATLTPIKDEQMVKLIKTQQQEGSQFENTTDRIS